VAAAARIEGISCTEKCDADRHRGPQNGGPWCHSGATPSTGKSPPPAMRRVMAV